MALISNAMSVKSSVYTKSELFVYILCKNQVLSDYVSNDFDYSNLLSCYKEGLLGWSGESPGCGLTPASFITLVKLLKPHFPLTQKGKNNSHHQFYQLLEL